MLRWVSYVCTVRPDVCCVDIYFEKQAEQDSQGSAVLSDFRKHCIAGLLRFNLERLDADHSSAKIRVFCVDAGTVPGFVARTTELGTDITHVLRCSDRWDNHCEYAATTQHSRCSE